MLLHFMKLMIFKSHKNIIITKRNITYITYIVNVSVSPLSRIYSRPKIPSSTALGKSSIISNNDQHSVIQHRKVFRNRHQEN